MKTPKPHEIRKMLQIGVVLLGFACLAYYIKDDPEHNELNSAQSESVSSLFNNPEQMIIEMSSVGVGEFYRYNCNDIGECEAYHGARTWEKNPNGLIGMSINGISNRVDSIRVVLEVDKDADLQRVLESYNQVLINTMEKLGVLSFNPIPFTTNGLKFKKEGQFIITGEITDKSYRSVTIKHIPH